jgi:DNA-binding transcriptional LysR family regulator
MHEPSLAEMNAFVAVLERKSFTKAAKQLELSTARVSEMVRNLEERLGVRLVERTTRSVAPTVAGERLLERLRPVLDDCQAALESTNEFRGKPAGTLRLTVAAQAADYVLAEAIPRFLHLYPEISLDITVENAFGPDLAAGRFDAGIHAGEWLARDMIAMRISGEMPIVVAAAPSYLARRAEPNTPRELAAHDCIRFRLSGGDLFPCRFRIKRRTTEVHVDGRVIVNDVRLAVRYAVEGVGLLQAPLDYVAPQLAAGRLVTVLDGWAPPAFSGYFLYHSSRRQNRPALKALVDFLRHARREASASN